MAIFSVFPLKIVIFHSYVSLPEGNVGKTIINKPWLGRVKNDKNIPAYKNGDHWGMVSVSLFYPHHRYVLVINKNVYLQWLTMGWYK